jgi:hypothetical protein
VQQLEAAFHRERQVAAGGGVKGSPSAAGAVAAGSRQAPEEGCPPTTATADGAAADGVHGAHQQVIADIRRQKLLDREVRSLQAAVICWVG